MTRTSHFIIEKKNFYFKGNPSIVSLLLRTKSTHPQNNRKSTQKDQNVCFIDCNKFKLSTLTETNLIYVGQLFICKFSLWFRVFRNETFKDNARMLRRQLQFFCFLSLENIFRSFSFFCKRYENIEMATSLSVYNGKIFLLFEFALAMLMVCGRVLYAHIVYCNRIKSDKTFFHKINY